jgi:flagellar motor switch protein FliM
MDALMEAASDNGVAGRARAAPTPLAPLETYDLAAPKPMAERHRAVLAQVNERFCQRLRVHLHALLNRHVTIEPGTLRLMTMGEYLHSLSAPISINLVHLGPVQTAALVVFDPGLIDVVVDQFFGGGGTRRAVQKQDFTPAERRIIRMLVTHSGEALQQAWGPFVRLEWDFIRMEVDPRLAAARGGNQVATVVVNPFSLDLGANSGAFDVCMPVELLGLLRGRLAAPVQAPEQTPDAGFKRRLAVSMHELTVELSSTLARAKVPLQDLMRLRVGDVVPVEVPETVTLNAGNVALYRGTYGVSDGRRAIRITETLTRDAATVAGQRAHSWGGDHE